MTDLPAMRHPSLPTGQTVDPVDTRHAASLARRGWVAVEPTVDPLPTPPAPTPSTSSPSTRRPAAQPSTSTPTPSSGTSTAPHTTPNPTSPTATED